MKCAICDKSKPTKERKGLEEVVANSNLEKVQKLKAKDKLEICDDCYDENFGVKPVRLGPSAFVIEKIAKALRDKEKREKKEKEGLVSSTVEA